MDFDFNSAQNPKSERLLVHEWIAILGIIGLLAMLTAVALVSNKDTNPPVTKPHYIVDQEIVVFVEGAVDKPGRYTVKKGALLKDIVSLAQPKAEANLKGLRMESKLKNGRVIKIPVKKSKKKNFDRLEKPS